MRLLKRAKLFFLKDLTIFFSYKLSIFNQLAVMALLAYILFSFSKISGINDLSFLEETGIDFFTFLFVGLVFTDTSIRILVSLPAMIRSYQTIGILEELFHTSKNKELEMVFLNNLYSLFLCIFRALFFYLLFMMFSEDAIKINILISALVFFLHMISMYGIGLICASYSMIFKNNNLIQSFFIIGTTFFSSAFVPLNVFEQFIQNLSILFPSTFSLEIFRNMLSFNSLIGNESTILSLVILSVSYLLMGAFTFKISVKLSKKYGNMNFF